MPVPPLKSLRFARVALTGRFLHGRDHVASAIAAARGQVVTTVSRTTSAVIVGGLGWPLLPDGSVGHMVRRAWDLNRRGGRVRVLSERELLRLAGAASPADRSGTVMTLDAAAESLGIQRDQLDDWARLGLIDPGEGGVDFQELVSLRTVAALVSAGVRPARINESLHGLATHLPGTDRPLAQLQLLAESPARVVATIGGLTLDPKGQLLLDFYAEPKHASTNPARPMPAPPTPTDPAGAAQACERRGDFTEAARLYRLAIADASSGDRPTGNAALAILWFNLGNTLRELGESAEVERALRVAVRLDDRFAEAWYNLADAIEDRAPDEAIMCLRRAVEVQPDYADAHFNLASSLEAGGDTSGAGAHWRRYLELDPESEWARHAADRAAAISGLAIR